MFFSNWKYIAKETQRLKYAFQDFQYQNTPNNDKQRMYMAMSAFKKKCHHNLKYDLQVFTMAQIKIIHEYMEKIIFNSIKKNGIAEISFQYFIDWKREYRTTNSTLAFFFILQGPWNM